ncbi:hypothetical protein FQA39_LY09813 [Lamprigera yunnana]|nr:hypothetical protein FQA39_LY09813 [Lamprigera yunnana]
MHAVNSALFYGKQKAKRSGRNIHNVESRPSTSSLNYLRKGNKHVYFYKNDSDDEEVVDDSDLDPNYSAEEAINAKNNSNTDDEDYEEDNGLVTLNDDNDTKPNIH